MSAKLVGNVGDVFSRDDIKYEVVLDKDYDAEDDENKCKLCVFSSESDHQCEMGFDDPDCPHCMPKFRDDNISVYFTEH